MTERRDVQSSLAEMDRKLRELQRELAMVNRRPEVPFPAPPPASDPGLAAGEPTMPPPTAEPVAPAPPPPPSGAMPAAEAEARAIVAGARAEAARIVEEAAASVAAIGQQIDELQRVRDELERSARALVEEYERALRQSPAAMAPPAPAPQPAPEPPAPPQPPVAAFVQPSPPPAAPPTAQAAPTAAHPAGGGQRFEGQVVLNAGPFTDIAALASFEQALARLPQAEDVYVRGFEGNRALVDIKLAAPLALLDEMRRALPFGFALVEVAHGRITIDVEGPPADAPTTPGS